MRLAPAFALRPGLRFQNRPRRPFQWRLCGGAALPASAATYKMERRRRRQNIDQPTPGQLTGIAASHGLSQNALHCLSLLASPAALAGEKTVTLAVENMYCSACPITVKSSLEAVPSDTKAVVSYPDKRAVVT
jgi:hypothetical protein